MRRMRAGLRQACQNPQRERGAELENPKRQRGAVLQHPQRQRGARRKAQRVAAGDTTTFGTYSFYADTRRAGKVVEHCGPEAVANDGGDQTVTFYYGGVPGAAGGVSRWNIFETRNGAQQATRQWVWGTRYVDEVLFMDVNGNPAAGNLCDPDDPNAPAGTKRYHYHQDRNWNVIALTEGAGGVDGRIAERYSFTPYGEFVVIKGDEGSGVLGNAVGVAITGNPFGHQALAENNESGGVQNRYRQYAPPIAEFQQRDPLHEAAFPDPYGYVGSGPLHRLDPAGLMWCPHPPCGVGGQVQGTQPASQSVWRPVFVPPGLTQQQADDCCRQLGQMTPPGNSGVTGCCYGKAIGCTKSGRPFTGFDTCTNAHETEHARTCNCPHANAITNCTRPQSGPGSRWDSECDAHNIEYACLQQQEQAECTFAPPRLPPPPYCHEAYKCRQHYTCTNAQTSCANAGRPNDAPASCPTRDPGCANSVYTPPPVVITVE